MISILNVFSLHCKLTHNILSINSYIRNPAGQVFLGSCFLTTCCGSPNEILPGERGPAAQGALSFQLFASKLRFARTLLAINAYRQLPRGNFEHPARPAPAHLAKSIRIIVEIILLKADIWNS